MTAIATIYYIHCKYHIKKNSCNEPFHDQEYSVFKKKKKRTRITVIFIKIGPKILEQGPNCKWIKYEDFSC